VGTISLELKKVDTKKNSYTLVVYADDKAVPKPNRASTSRYSSTAAKIRHCSR